MNTPTPYSSEPIDLQSIELGRAIDRAVSDCMNAFAPDLPAQFWMYEYLRDTPEISCAVLDESALAQWATRLCLEPAEGLPGTRNVTGEAWINRRRHTVSMWCVVDQAAYDADIAVYHARYGS